MAIYRCDECDQMIDDDYFPCVEHPTDAEAYCCESCADKVEEREDKEFKRMKAEYEREIISGLQRRMK